MEEPVPASLYLGCKHNYKTEHEVNNVIYAMTYYLMPTVEAYQEICETATGKSAVLKKVATPLVEDEQLAARAKAPCPPRARHTMRMVRTHLPGRQKV